MSEHLPHAANENDDAKIVEAAFTAALSRPENPINNAHKDALAAEEYLNEYLESVDPEEDSAEISETIADVVNELDRTCGHMGDEIVVTGLIKMRTLDHRQVDADTKSITKDVYEDVWTPVERRVATSLGYFAQKSDVEGKLANIYHGAETKIESIFYSSTFGSVYTSKRLFIPIDGTADAELQYAPRSTNFELLDYYLGEEMMYQIDDALHNKESLNDTLHSLGKIDLKKAAAISVDPDVRFALIDYVNHTLDLKQEIPYEISGASFVDYDDDEGNPVFCRLNPKIAMTGHLDGIGIDLESNRFRLVASMPFSDDTVQNVSYRITPRLSVQRHKSFVFSTTAKLRIQ